MAPRWLIVGSIYGKPEIFDSRHIDHTNLNSGNYWFLLVTKMPTIKVSDETFSLLVNDARALGVPVKELADMIVGLYYSEDEEGEDEEEDEEEEEEDEEEE